MNGRIDSGLGQIIIDTDVIATYAGSVAVECFGIVGMAAVSMKAFTGMEIDKIDIYVEGVRAID